MNELQQPITDNILDRLMPSLHAQLHVMGVQWVQIENARLKFKYKDCFIELTIKQVKE